AMAQTLGEYGLKAVVVGPSNHSVHAHDAPARIWEKGAIGDRIGHAGRLIEADVRVVLDTVLVSAASEHVVGLDGHVARELPLHPDGGLDTVGDVRKLGRRSEFRRITE